MKIYNCARALFLLAEVLVVLKKPLQQPLPTLLTSSVSTLSQETLSDSDSKNFLCDKEKWSHLNMQQLVCERPLKQTRMEGNALFYLWRFYLWQATSSPVPIWWRDLKAAVPHLLLLLFFGISLDECDLCSAVSLLFFHSDNLSHELKEGPIDFPIA